MPTIVGGRYSVFTPVGLLPIAVAGIDIEKLLLGVKDAMQNDIFWMSGRFDNWEKENKKTDEWALSNGYASVVPVKVDMTHYEIIDQLKHWEQEVFTK